MYEELIKEYMDHYGVTEEEAIKMIREDEEPQEDHDMFYLDDDWW